MTLESDTLPEMTEAEIAAIDNASLEDLLEDLTGLESLTDAVEAGDEPVESLEPAFESLMQIVTDIQGSGHIARNDAAVLLSMSASMESFNGVFENMPLASYTELPSKVNYAPSMENILSRIVETIVRKIRELIEWIKKSIKGALALFRSREPINRKIGAAAKQAKARFDANKVNPAYWESPKRVNGIVNLIANTDFARRTFNYLDQIDDALVKAGSRESRDYLQVANRVKALNVHLMIGEPCLNLADAVPAMERIKKELSLRVSEQVDVSGAELKGFLTNLANNIEDYRDQRITLTTMAANIDQSIAEAQAEIKSLLERGGAAEEIREVQHRMEEVRRLEEVAMAVVYVRSILWNGIGSSVQLIAQAIKA